MTDLTILPDFRKRASKKPEHLGDTAANAQRYDEAVSLYTAALSFHPRSPQGLLIKRSKAYTALGSWKQALDDANQVHLFIPGRPISLTRPHQVIEGDPSLPWGHELKHAALHKAGDYDNAILAFEEMLSNIKQSPDPDIRREFVLVVTMKTIVRLHAQRTS